MGNYVKNDSIYLGTSKGQVQMMPYIRTLTPEESAEVKKRAKRMKEILPPDWMQKSLDKINANSTNKKPRFMAPASINLTPEQAAEHEKIGKQLEYFRNKNKNIFTNKKLR